MDRPLRVTLICGGHGASYVIKALLYLIERWGFNIIITCICPNTDTGKSTGKLVKMGGSGATGDATSCIVALTPDQVLANWLCTRYEEGELSGHSYKNMVLHSWEIAFGSLAEAIEVMSKRCNIFPHRVLPVTDEKSTLCAVTVNGTPLIGEEEIDQFSRSKAFDVTVHRLKNVWLDPPVKASPEVLKIIRESDFILGGLGSWTTTQKAILSVGGLKEAFEKSLAKLIMMINLTTQPGDTHGYNSEDFVKKIEPYFGRPVDYIVANNGMYPKSGARKDFIDLQTMKRAFRGRLVKIGKRDDPRLILSDLLAANLDIVHHDHVAVAKVLKRIFKNGYKPK